jgi:hypothetical protein
VAIVTQANAFIPLRLFEVWTQGVFFPAVEAGRLEFNHTHRVVFLVDELGTITPKSPSRLPGTEH